MNSDELLKSLFGLMDLAEESFRNNLLEESEIKAHAKDGEISIEIKGNYWSELLIIDSILQSFEKNSGRKYERVLNNLQMVHDIMSSESIFKTANLSNCPNEMKDVIKELVKNGKIDEVKEKLKELEK